MLPALTCGLLLGLVSADDAGQSAFYTSAYYFHTTKTILNPDRPDRIHADRLRRRSP